MRNFNKNDEDTLLANGEGRYFKDKITEWIFALSFGLWAGVLGISTNMILDRVDGVSKDFIQHKEAFATYQVMSKQDIIEIRERQVAIISRLNAIERDITQHELDHKEARNHNGG